MATWGGGTILCAPCRELAGEGAQKEDALLWAVNTFGAILAKVAGLERLDRLPENQKLIPIHKEFMNRFSSISNVSLRFSPDITIGLAWLS